jgi:hypothetical protein
MPELFNPASTFLNLDCRLLRFAPWSGSEFGMTADEYKAFGQALLIILFSYNRFLEKDDS